MANFIQNVESFAHTAEQTIAKLWGKAPGYGTVALTTIKFCAPLLETIVTLEGGPVVGAAVTAVVSDVETSLAAAVGVIKAIGPEPTLKDVFQGSVDNLSTLLTAAHVKNQVSKDRVSLVLTELNALVAAFPAPPVPPVPPAPTVEATK